MPTTMNDTTATQSHEKGGAAAASPCITMYYTDADVLTRAAAILAARVRNTSVLDSPKLARDFMQITLAPLDHEAFAVAFLDAQHRVIASEVMFRGTLSQTSVYPREVVKAALAHNAGAVIFAHNHPSGASEPSRADEHLTTTLKQALALVDVRVLDHLVVSVSGVVSFAERGLL